MAKNNENLKENGDGFFKRRANNVKKDFQANINYAEIKDTTDNIKDMASHVFSPKEQIKNAKVENFENAVAIRGVSDYELISLYKNYSVIFYISIASMVVCLLFIVITAFKGFSILTFLSLLSIMIVCGANAFKFSFRAFQIKHRKLCSIQNYLSKKDFFPTLNLK